MAVVYATLIVKGKKTIDQVPSLIRKQVEEILADLEVTVRPRHWIREGSPLRGPPFLSRAEMRIER